MLISVKLIKERSSKQIYFEGQLPAIFMIMSQHLPLLTNNH